jgi:hypothetical protein
MSDDDYFCQWCYDNGLRYPDDGKPWRHGRGCPNAAPIAPSAGSDDSAALLDWIAQFFTWELIGADSREMSSVYGWMLDDELLLRNLGERTGHLEPIPNFLDAIREARRKAGEQ